MQDNVCVVGLGYVGLTLGVYLASQGKKVYGIDVSDAILASLEQKKAHFYEENFDSQLKQVIANKSFTFGKAYKRLADNMTFVITVGTPLASDGKVNLATLSAVSESIAAILKDGDTIILRSTIKIGTTRGLVKKIVDNTRKSYYLGFCPERTLEGSAFEELANLPQIISGIDEASLAKIKQFFEPVCRECVATHSVEEAEMVKLLNNSERDLLFALGNEIALMCEEKGLNAYRVIEAANYQYPRSCLKKPGPVGGPCLEKDPYILTESFAGANYQPELFVTSRRVNERIIEKSLQRFFDHYAKLQQGKEPQKIAILGFAFKGKPATGDVRGSLVYQVISCVKNRYPYAKITGHDYLATKKDIEHAGANEATHDMNEALRDACLIILQNNHPQYKQENWKKLQSTFAKNAMIYDFWNQLDAGIFSGNIAYVALGRFQ